VLESENFVPAEANAISAKANIDEESIRLNKGCRVFSIGDF
jgi:hypothetical protein